MIIKNGHIFTDQGRFMQADIKLEGDRIVEIAPAGTLEGDEVIDATGKYVTPRLRGHPHPRRCRQRLLRRHHRGRGEDQPLRGQPGRYHLHGHHHGL